MKYLPGISFPFISMEGRPLFLKAHARPHSTDYATSRSHRRTLFTYSNLLSNSQQKNLVTFFFHHGRISIRLMLSGRKLDCDWDSCCCCACDTWLCVKGAWDWTICACVICTWMVKTKSFDPPLINYSDGQLNIILFSSLKHQTGYRQSTTSSVLRLAGKMSHFAVNWLRQSF